MIYNHFMENSITEALDMLVFSPKLERGFAGVPVIFPLHDVLKLHRGEAPQGSVCPPSISHCSINAGRSC